LGFINFRDRHYKASEKAIFSTAVTQGAILIKALEDSKWFIPIEREIWQFAQERNLIRSTRQEYTKDVDPNATT
jgi:curli production assembly/transport component CsgG